METLEAKKVRLLGKFLSSMVITSEFSARLNATSIISLLDEVEQAYYQELEELNFQTHCGEVYGD